MRNPAYPRISVKRFKAADSLTKKPPRLPGTPNPAENPFRPDGNRLRVV